MAAQFKRTKGPAGSQALLVNQLRTQFFARTGFTIDEHRGIGGGDDTRQTQRMLESLARSHDPGRVFRAIGGGIRHPLRSRCYLAPRELGMNGHDNGSRHLCNSS